MPMLSYSFWTVQIPEECDRRMRYYGAIPTLLENALDEMNNHIKQPSVDEVVHRIHEITGMYPIGHTLPTERPPIDADKSEVAEMLCRRNGFSDEFQHTNNSPSNKRNKP